MLRHDTVIVLVACVVLMLHPGPNLWRPYPLKPFIPEHLVSDIATDLIKHVCKKSLYFRIIPRAECKLNTYLAKSPTSTLLTPKAAIAHACYGLLY